MPKRVFSLQDQLAFANLSGDHNPLHVDPVAARRLLFGGPVVHGMHLLLWTLETWLQERATPLCLRSLAADFSRPLDVGAEVSCDCLSERDGHVKIKLLSEGFMVAAISWEFVAAAGAAPNDRDFDRPQGEQCKERSADEMMGASGATRLELDAVEAARLFPNLMKRIPVLQIAQIATTSRLVGMECPGLHSVYSKVKLAFETVRSSGQMLEFSVVRYDERFGLVLLEIAAAGLRGSVKAILRPRPTGQARCIELLQRVGTDEFDGQRALIIGGSRGLGALACKLLSLGGGEVRLTYNHGRQDADDVVQDIVENGGAAAAFAYDVLQSQGGLTSVGKDGWSPTHFYFFATPFISVRTRWPHAFSQAAFQRFCDFYVTGFVNAFNAARAISTTLSHVFYPSSVLIDELPGSLGEYMLAKRAGEAACEFLERHFPSIAFYRPRLPRLATDQTASMIAVEMEDAASVMLSLLREFLMMMETRMSDQNR